MCLRDCHVCIMGYSWSADRVWDPLQPEQVGGDKSTSPNTRILKPNLMFWKHGRSCQFHLYFSRSERAGGLEQSLHVDIFAGLASLGRKEALAAHLGLGALLAVSCFNPWDKWKNSELQFPSSFLEAETVAWRGEITCPEVIDWYTGSFMLKASPRHGSVVCDSTTLL